MKHSVHERTRSLSLTIRIRSIIREPRKKNLKKPGDHAKLLNLKQLQVPLGSAHNLQEGQ